MFSSFTSVYASIILFIFKEKIEIGASLVLIWIVKIKKQLEIFIFQLKFKNASGKIKNPLEIKLLRRDIARIKTVLAESKLSKEKEE